MSKKARGHATSGTANVILWLMAAGCLAAVLLVAWWWTSKSYPETTSSEGLKLIRALYTACSSRNEERLARVERELTELENRGALSEAERAAFGSIIEQAHTGDWKAAIDESYQFAEDQVR